MSQTNRTSISKSSINVPVSDFSQAGGAGPREALLHALRIQIADIVPLTAAGSIAMPLPAAVPAAAGTVHDTMSGLGGRAISPSVCPFSSATALIFGVAAIDECLPAYGLGHGSLNEFKPATPRDSASALTLALTLAARALPALQPLLLVQSGHSDVMHGMPYGPGISGLGLDPERLIIAKTPCLGDALWTIEEGLRSGALAAVVGLLDSARHAISMLQARRLILAANEGGTVCLLITGAGHEGLNMAHSRWRTARMPSAPHPLDAEAPGPLRCSIHLERCRNGPSGLNWHIEWKDGGKLVEVSKARSVEHKRAKR